MTTREKSLLALVGAAIAGWLLFNYAAERPVFMGKAQSPKGRLAEAQRLLRSSLNIEAYHRLSLKSLQALEKRFLPAGDPEKAEIELLQEVEDLAYQAQLSLQRKNIVHFNDNAIGVTLEGKSSPESVFRFMQQTTVSQIGLRIWRLQLHVLPESKMLNYQITLNSLLVEAK